MARFDQYLSQEMIIYAEQLARLIREATHHHNVAYFRTVHGAKEPVFQPPSLQINGQRLSSLMEDDCK